MYPSPLQQTYPANPYAASAPYPYPQPHQPPTPHHHHEPIFTVSPTKHTGALVLWVDQHSTVTGNYQRCEAALRQAQMHCLLAGWWSPLSALILNWLALFANWAALKLLRKQAAQAFGSAPAYRAPAPQPYAAVMPTVAPGSMPRPAPAAAPQPFRLQTR